MKKLLKFDKLFEYYKYLENINSASFNEIKNMSDMLDNHQISEGLIKTYPLQLSITILKRKFPTCDIQINDDEEIIITGNLDKNKIKILSNTLGYIISKEYDNAMLLEPKYDREIENVPEIIYHSTLLRYLNSIEKYGLIPKSKNKLSNHPDRIYFSLTLEDALLFKKYFENEHDEKSIIIKISTANLDNKFYSDINFRDRGIYTLNNISKDNILDIIK